MYEKSILIVDDNLINREVLKAILEPEYHTLDAEDGVQALKILEECPGKVIAVLMDIVMPNMDGFQLLKKIKEDVSLSNLPIVVMTANNDNEQELKALKLGAWDFVTKPFNQDLILTRLKNAIARSEIEVARQMSFLASHDELTGLSNKSHFSSQTSFMLSENKDKQFVFIYFDIERFQLINSFYGENEGNNVIKYVAKCLSDYDHKHSILMKYCRIESSVFSICMEYDEKNTLDFMEEVKNALENYNADYDIEPSFGLYVIEDNTASIESIYNNAVLADRLNESNYLNYYSFYTKEMGETLKREQGILNDMQRALDNEEFKVYLQPKYNINTNKICGSEALVRWLHPVHGMVSPGDFIPLFERNGFITKLDYYMWEHVCILIRKWMDEGIDPKPVSVNVSRVNIYNSRVVESIVDLIKKYDIPPQLLELEITESAYTDNPGSLMGIVSRLKKSGFSILMDDFGSGYSSLSILKDIQVDVLKIDLRFLSNENDTGRGENIIASIIRMAKWLRIPVIVEGVEKNTQVAFLRTVGCDYVQGFYYAKPMPVDEYEKLVEEDRAFDVKEGDGLEIREDFDIDALFQSNPQMKLLFGDFLRALAFFEFDGKKIEYIRINEGFFEIFGSDDPAVKAGNPMEFINKEHRKKVLDTFRLTVKTKGTTECDYLRTKADGSSIWINLQLRYIRSVGDNYLILGVAEDITAQKKIDAELSKYRKAVASEFTDDQTMLIVDDAAANRAILKKIFQEQYNIVEAKDGLEALAYLKNNNNVAVILLDIVMPRMNGWEFLEHKKKDMNIVNIPVVVITAEDKFDEQMNALDLGTNDYIIKPFVPDIVRKRVGNVMNSIRLMSEIVKKYDSATQLSKIDKVTGLFNQESAGAMIEDFLKSSDDNRSVMILCRLFGLKNIIENQNHEVCEHILKSIGDIYKELFRGDDICFRLNVDTFGVFAKSFKDKAMLIDRCEKLVELLEGASRSESDLKAECCIGVVYATNDDRDFIKIRDKSINALDECRDENKKIYFIQN